MSAVDRRVMFLRCPRNENGFSTNSFCTDGTGMRHIGNLPEEKQARTFEDYLLTLGIKSMAEAEEGGWAVWVYDEDDVAKAREEFQRFCENPADARYQQAARAAEAQRRAEQKLLEEFRKHNIDVRRQWERPSAARTPVTTVFIALSVLVAVLTTDFRQGIWHLCNRSDSLLPYLYIAPVLREGDKIYWSPAEGLSAVRRGQVHRLVTPIFIHFDILHLLFNMLWLKTLGGAIELRRGSRRLLGLILFVAVTSNLAQYRWNVLAFGGMSGVDFGLFGYIWMKSKYDPPSGFFMPSQLVFFMIAYMVICYTGIMPIANAAHTVGLLAGMAVGLWPVLRRRLAGR